MLFYTWAVLSLMACLLEDDRETVTDAVLHLGCVESYGMYLLFVYKRSLFCSFEPVTYCRD